MGFWRAMSAFALCIGLASCGGGDSSSDGGTGGNGGGGSTPPPADAQALARDAQIISHYDFATETFSLEWKDTFPAGGSYQVLRMTGAGSPTRTFTSEAAAGKTLWGGPVLTPTTYQVQGRLRPTEPWVPLMSASGNADIIVAPPPPTPTLRVSPDEDMHNLPVQFSLDGLDPSYKRVEWRINEAMVAEGGLPAMRMIDFPGNKTVSLRADLFTDDDHGFIVKKFVSYNRYIGFSTLTASQASGILTLIWTFEFLDSPGAPNIIGMGVGDRQTGIPGATQEVGYGSSDRGPTAILTVRVPIENFPRGNTRLVFRAASNERFAPFFMSRVVNADDPNNITIH